MKPKCTNPACGADAKWENDDGVYCDVHKVEDSSQIVTCLEIHEQIVADKVCQTVVIRKDLKMHKGKIAAQASHAFMIDLVEMWRNGVNPEDLVGAAKEYYLTKFRKIVLAANSEAELDELYQKAKAAGLKCHMVIDSGETEFNGVPTKTCICIGPHYKSEIFPVTGHLKPL